MPDAAGRILTYVAGPTAESWTYTYDKLGRLLTSTNSSDPSSSRSFSYDAAGNITSNSAIGAYAYPAQGPTAIRPHAAQRLGTLFHEGYLDRPLAQWRNANARYRPAVYQLADKVKAALAEYGFAALHHNAGGGSFAHELMVAEIMASLELAARSDAALRHLSWQDLLDGAPAETQASSDPFAFPVAIAYRDGRMTFELKPDGRPFGLECSHTNGTRRALFFPGIEVDRHTEPLSAFDLERSSIAKKVQAYREMVATDLYKSRLGFPNMLVPIVTVNRRHMENMIRLVLDLTNGKGAGYLLFKAVPDFDSFEKTVQPDPSLLGEPWSRAGYPPFDIVKELGHTA